MITSGLILLLSLQASKAADAPVLWVSDFTETEAGDAMRRIPSRATRSVLLKSAYFQEFADRGLDPAAPGAARRLAEARSRDWGSIEAGRVVDAADVLLRCGDLEGAKALVESSAETGPQAGATASKVSTAANIVAQATRGRTVSHMVWGFAPGVGALMLGGAIWAVVRLAPRTGPPPASPYIVGTPIRDASRAHGRDELIERTMRALDAGLVVYLHGPPRIGKSTVLYQIMARWLARSGLDTARLISLEGIEPEEIPHRIVAEIGRMAGAPGLLVVDEADHLGRISVHSARQLVGAAFGLQSRVRVLMAGLGGLDAASVCPPGSLEIEVRPLGDAACASILTEACRELLRFEDAVVEKVLKRAEGQPMLVQIYGTRLFEVAHGRWSRTPRGFRIPIRTRDLDRVQESVDREWAIVQSVSSEEEGAPTLRTATFELARLLREAELRGGGVNG